MSANKGRSILGGAPPRLIPSLIAVPAVLAMLGLGTWQLARMVEKDRANALRGERMAAVAVDLPARLDDPPRWEFRRVRVVGRLRHEAELYLNARSQRGNAGYHVVTPLVRDGAPPVLVSRGWVPYERKAPQTRAAAQVQGPVEIVGILRREPRRGWLMPENDAQRNEWFWYDLPAMARATALPELAPFYIEADATPNPGGFPIGGQTVAAVPSPHLQYAVTWYALALALAVIYVLWHRQRGG
jgi:surfeit locus 1 family protein